MQQGPGPKTGTLLVLLMFSTTGLRFRDGPGTPSQTQVCPLLLNLIRR
jgi:hypothetical protein